MTYLPPEPWTGRLDGDTPEHLRWHQHVTLGDAASTVDRSVALVGFASDAGVVRNHGRPGAAEGPAALRKALAPLAVHTTPQLVDLGDVRVEGDDLEAGHAAFGRLVTQALDAHGLVIVLGGGHETAWGTYLGRTASERLAGRTVGVLNLDAHFDLRAADRATSGTPFLQMADADAAAGRAFRYLVAGIARASNTKALFGTAERLDAEVVLDVDCQPSRLDVLLDRVDAFVAGVDAVHLSIDLDVLPAAVAPGVSAPAGYGVGMEVLDAVCARVSASGKLVVADVVELCPPHDVDGRTARAAARLIHTLAEAWRPLGARPLANSPHADTDHEPVRRPGSHPGSATHNSQDPQE